MSMRGIFKSPFYTPFPLAFSNPSFWHFQIKSQFLAREGIPYSPKGDPPHPLSQAALQHLHLTSSILDPDSD